MLSINPGNGPGLDVFDGKSLWPTGEPIHDCEEVLEAVGLREGSNQVDVDVIESSGCWLELLDRLLGMDVDLRTLTIQACPCPMGDLLAQSMPDKLRGHQSLGQLDSRMGQRMHYIENSAFPVFWYNRSRHAR